MFAPSYDIPEDFLSNYLNLNGTYCIYFIKQLHFSFRFVDDLEKSFDIFKIFLSLFVILLFISHSNLNFYGLFDFMIISSPFVFQKHLPRSHQEYQMNLNLYTSHFSFFFNIYFRTKILRHHFHLPINRFQLKPLHHFKFHLYLSPLLQSKQSKDRL